jgi:cbb3-type cytochrome oxidase subunit 1
MFFDLMIAGLVHGFMQRDLNDWSDILRMSEPFWWVRAFSGVMILVGLFCALYNMFMTARAGAAYQEDKHYIPANAD